MTPSQRFFVVIKDS